MDQDSTNGTSTDKPKWRDRLGIGAKDMPRISDEFKPPAGKPDGPAPQPVTKLAPMAPRANAQQPSVPPENREPQRPPEMQNAEGLAEKLRGQRAAAEMLAVQRVSAARQRAEARIAAEPRNSGRMNDTPPKDITPSRPKFSFAEEEQPGKRQEPALSLDKSSNGARTPSGIASAPSLVPPRPALGGERMQSPLVRQPGSSPYRSDGTTPPFRPIDPATGYPGPSSSWGVPGNQRGFAQDSGGLPPLDRNAMRKPAYEPFRRGHDLGSYGADNRNEDRRGDPRLGHSLAIRSKGHPAPEELDDVFEDEAPPRRRAGASDYQSAYREAEEGDSEDRRRSNGPWLLLLALLVAACATGGVILLWTKSTETVATNGTGATDAVPLIAAPEEPTKTAAERPADNAGDVAAVNRKQIYDRIVGDQEVTGDTVVPTEVTPIQPEASESRGVSPTGSDDIDEAVPLALPPAPGQNTEGRLERDTDQRVVAAAGQSGTEEIKSETTSRSSDSIGSLLPSTGVEEVAPPETKAATGDTASLASTEPDSAASVEPETQPAAPVKKKAATAKKKRPPAGTTASLGDPNVVVPPASVTAPSQEGFEAGTLPSDPAPKQAPARRKRTLFDLFSGNKSEAAPAQEVTGQQPAPQANRLASLPVETLPAETVPVETVPVETVKPAPEKQAVASGYVVQLASFRNPDEAQTEFARLRSKYPSVIGALPSSISQTTVAGSTRHTLGLGPLTTQEQASQICGSLLAGGERDCRVRKQ